MIALHRRPPRALHEELELELARVGLDKTANPYNPWLDPKAWIFDIILLTPGAIVGYWLGGSIFWAIVGSVGFAPITLAAIWLGAGP